MPSTSTDRSGQISTSVAVKAPCACATTANITLQGEQTIDGVMTSSSRVLVKNQTLTINNGVYVSNTGNWTRDQDFDGTNDVVQGTLVPVYSGGQGSSFWQLTTASPVIGSSNLTFSRYISLNGQGTAAPENLGNNIIDDGAGNLTLRTGHASLASASTTDLGSVTQVDLTITGTTTITSFGTSMLPGQSKTVTFAGALTLTYNATSLILPGAANITTAANDRAIITCIASGNYAVIYQPNTALATSMGGTGVTASDPVIQRVKSLTGAVATGTTTFTLNNSTPQNTSGDQYMSLAITPKNAANILVIQALINVSNSGTSPFIMAAMLFQDSTVNALSVGTSQCTVTTGMNQIRIYHEMAAGTTAATTFKIRAGGSVAGTTTFNGQSGTGLFNGVLESSLVITEYAS